MTAHKRAGSPAARDPLVGTVPLADVSRWTIDKLQIIDPITWHGKSNPPRRWIVGPLIPEAAVTLITGHGGTGKSTIALQLLVCAALGRDWFGWPTRPCKAFGLFCEDTADELHRRTADIVRHYDAELGDLENLRLVTRVGADNLLMEFENQWSPGEETPLYGQILNEVTNFGAEIVVLDSLHDLYGGNENSRPQARRFINSLRTIATEIRGAVLLVGHPSRSGIESGSGEAGSTAWRNATRSRLYIRKATVDQDGQVDYVLESAKPNYGGKIEPMGLTWSKGAFIRDAPATETMASLRNGRIEKTFLACLDAATAQGRAFSEHKTTANFGPKIAAKMRGADGFTARDFELAMGRLFDDGVIEVGKPFFRPNRHPAKGIVRTNPHQSCRDGE